MDILMVSAELSPYARGSEVGDVVAGLSKALRQLGHRVTVALPRHPGFEAGGLLMARRSFRSGVSTMPSPSDWRRRASRTRCAPKPETAPCASWLRVATVVSKADRTHFTGFDRFCREARTHAISPI